MHSGITDTVLKIIAETTCKDLTVEDGLLERGLVDSISVVHIALALEEAFGCTVPAADIVRVFASVRSLTAFVESHAVRGR
ncbi:D-alanine--poly(phosphoribitol) ligase subunit 2 [mine drainage metagenome]|uniref:D-alanine--poly(Phosphoribitol) ligase subunit 2 n=1 Tax=mine drainage metagenome TaxID=410659 RepID=A0A1J5RGZ6_9ZZZZ